MQESVTSSPAARSTSGCAPPKSSRVISWWMARIVYVLPLVGVRVGVGGRVRLRLRLRVRARARARARAKARAAHLPVWPYMRMHAGASPRAARRTSGATASA